MKCSFIITVLLGLQCLVSCSGKDAPKTKEASYFKEISRNDIPLGLPEPGSWRAVYGIKKQTFEQYKEGNPFVPSAGENTIYLQPVGTFDSLQQKALSLTRDYLQVFFQRKTVLLPNLPGKAVPGSAQRMKFGHEQWRSTYFIDNLLSSRFPKGGIALMAFTDHDLYPSESWNYVFGQASYDNRTGVTSIYRLQDSVLKKENFTRCLSRLLNISSHEIGHMLSMHHCNFAVCTMNGSNDLPETDRSPNRLCSECQMKLAWCLHYDSRKRLRELLAFFRKNKLGNDLALTVKDSISGY